MFFRRKRPESVGFSHRLDKLRKLGFTVEPEHGAPGRHRVARAGCAAVVAEGGAGAEVAIAPGVLVGAEIGALVDGGFQKFLRTAEGVQKPALAAELKALHSFQQDLDEALGLESLYNESLGTVSKLYLYDRVKGRDRGARA